MWECSECRTTRCGECQVSSTRSAKIVGTASAAREMEGCARGDGACGSGSDPVFDPVLAALVALPRVPPNEAYSEICAS